MFSAGAVMRAPGAPTVRLLFWGQFESSILEERYRRQHLQRDTARAVFILVIAVIPTLLFAVSDYRLFGTATPFFWLLSVRTAQALFSLCILVALLKGLTPRNLDRALLSWSVSAALCDIYICSTRPADYTGHFLFEVVFVVLLYTALPAPLPYQAIPALIVCAGSIFLLLTVKTPTDGLTGTALAVAYFLANVLGGVSSWELHRWKRRQFVELDNESTLRVSLEKALGEIKTLRGLLAICANCKRVRDDAGAWQQVEVFVRDRTHANFSHAICPQCMKALYGDMTHP